MLCRPQNPAYIAVSRQAAMTMVPTCDGGPYQPAVRNGRIRNTQASYCYSGQRSAIVGVVADSRGPVMATDRLVPQLGTFQSNLLGGSWRC